MLGFLSYLPGEKLDRPIGPVALGGTDWPAGLLAESGGRDAGNLMWARAGGGADRHAGVYLPHLAGEVLRSSVGLRRRWR